MSASTHKPGMSVTLRALAHLLNYPDAERRAALPDVLAALHDEHALGEAHQADIDILIAALQRTNVYDVEAGYIEVFDRGRSTSLHLFEHVHGDSRDRGPAMVDLIKTYEAAGLYLDDGELPDFLPVVLEYASTQPSEQARAFLGEFAHILNAIFNALQQRGSDYAVVLAALLELAGQTVQPVRLTPDQPLDETWTEPEVFGGCSSSGQDRPDQPQPIHIIRNPSSSRIGAIK